jgi:hypothetical protein
MAVNKKTGDASNAGSGVNKINQTKGNNMRAVGTITRSPRGARGVSIDGNGCFSFMLEHDDHPEFTIGDQVTIEFDPQDQYAKIVDESATEKQVYMVLHEHRHGSDIWLVRSNQIPSEDEVLKHCNIDFEPDRGESITIAPFDLKEIVEIPDGKEAI